MDNFVSICKFRGLAAPEIPDDGNLVRSLAELVLNFPEYTIPTFASFGSLALPIASEWIVGDASIAEYAKVFCRLSSLAPLLSYLQPLTEHLLMMQFGSNTSLAAMEDADVISGIIKLLLHDHSRFSRYFSAEELRSVASRSETLSIRTIALAALALLMEVSEHEFDKWTSKYCGNESESQAFEFNYILQSSRAKAEDSRLIEATKNIDITSDFIFENSLVTNVGGIFVPRLGGAGNLVSDKQFISTETSQANLSRVAKSLLTDKPLLLIGGRGSGKTSIVEYLHSRVRGGELVRIHLGDQTDAKSLVGTYTTGQKPGTFEWTPGALTSAVQNGSWVLIEDIDRAPNEIVSVLLSLLTSRELVIPSRNQVVKASPGFQIVATTSALASSETQMSVEVIGARTWVPVSIESPNTNDLETLVLTLKPFLTPLAASMLVTTFKRVEEWQEHHRLTRFASTRDLVKLVNRISQKYNTEDIFREAVSCFTSFLVDPLPLARVIGDSMGIGTSQIEPLLNRHQPSISISDHRLVVGRAEVERRNVTSSAARNMDGELQVSKFALTQPTLRLLEEIGIAVQHVEPVLLVGETGTGKTAVVQHLAKLSRRKLVVINVSQQVETGDLVGGFKPVDARQLSGTLLEEFADLFDATFSRAKNHQFVDVLDRMVSKQQWPNVIKLLREAVKMAGSKATTDSKASSSTGNTKRARTQDTSSSSDWNHFALQIDAFEQRLKSVQQAAQFQFIEGLLVRAIRQGAWVLLDELNLAPADTVEGIGELLSSRQLTLLESGGQIVHAHPAFRLFANMNPATDVGKRDLPAAVRSQFTELWSPSPESDLEALRAIVSRYLPPGTEGGIVNDVAQLYVEARNLAASHQLVDGAGQRPHFSIRTLSRALTTATTISKTYGLRRALFEAFCMCFLTLLDEKSASKLNSVVEEQLLSKLPNARSVLSHIPAMPASGNHVQFSHWWMPCGTGPAQEVSDYILTQSVERNLLNLVRAASTKMFPILIQGPTSSGKTSMISYLAKRTGHSVVRINNHEHTDLAEYLGGYESDSDGRLVFKEGALVKALRQGHWLVLDELNLAPTDVLEALNRLLDDNRELLVPETQEIIKPHPDFVLFATQNPPGLYAGRKVLSRAFRNRFLELHFGDIPEQELEIILRDRSGIAPSYAAKIVEVYRELARQRIQRVFEQAATLRDLFRWARRPAIGYEQLAFNGYALLGERSRSKQEREAVRKVIEKVMRVPIATSVAELASEEVMAAAPSDIVWTGAMRRVLALVEMAINQNEPVLLVGETGCGKTTIVQALAAARQQRLVTLNAHQNTETGDLVGSQRPVRSPQSTKLFEWVDGPLVVALREGTMFLLDEISLADDSVLERLNSVLETERTLFVPEIGAVEAADNFQFLSTMNPGGDYGKKELSPALRNRFTEIWCPTVDDEDDLRMIVNKRLEGISTQDVVASAINVIVDFSQWFTKEFGLVSLRDVLSWTEFINSVGISERNLAHGACMVFVDGLGTKSHLMANPFAISKARNACLKKLSALVGSDATTGIDVSEVLANENGSVTIGGFKLPMRDSLNPSPSSFSLAAPTSALNAMRVTRAMQVHKPVLLEGSPGAGKTSLIAALANICGEKLTRINLSDQTDLSDLFGQDVPLDEPGKFGWRSAPFLRAMQEGEWVLLDEMNLAPQPVLEGLNACLDHRGEAYIPELDKVFSKHPGFMVFAAQNPQGQGGGRKGLPKSFVNRFSVVYVDQLGLQDLHAISATTHPVVSAPVREKLATFIEELAQWSTSRVITGGPFEFNLRDTLRWLDLVAGDSDELPQKFLGLLVLQRFRTHNDREMVFKMFSKYFSPLSENMINPVSITPTSLRILNAETERTWFKWQVHDPLSILPGQLDILETGVRCIARNWPLILVGPSGSGKTSVVRLLAQLCGAKLREFAMTPDVDSTDLLGEFDQLEFESELQRLWSVIDDQVKSAAGVEDASLIDAVHGRNLETVKQLVPAEHPIHDAISSFHAQDFSKPIFHWVDGMLVKAVENGDWLILDNANLCSAAVLDRLNSLLERDGSLFVNECSQPDGSPREIKPHPDFRLFLTVNPRYGELSRAMRNRGVEVWLMPESSSYDERSKNKLTVSGALPLEFARPLTVARIADLMSNSWLRAVLLTENAIPVDSLSSVDSDLAIFYSEMLHHEKATTIGQLNQQWCVYYLQTKLSKAMASQSSNNLLELSALRRVRDSIECEFDVYGILENAIPLIFDGGKLGSVLFDLADVQDPSRIPVFRDWLLKYAEERNMPDFATIVQVSLGKQYDFSNGGVAMESIWQHYGRPLGYPSEAAHAEQQKALRLAETFDGMVEKIDLGFADQITEIRGMLSLVDYVDENLTAAVTRFQESLDLVATSSQSSVNMPRILMDQFKNLWSSLALVYSIRPLGDSEELKSSLIRLTSFAGLATSDLRSLIATDNRKLNVPNIMVPQALESTIIEALQLTSQSQGRDEVKEFVSTLARHSVEVVKGMDPRSLVSETIRRCARQIADVLPESVELEDLNKLLSGETADPSTDAIVLAHCLLDLYVCPLPLDPAIAQHVWYERYLRLKSEFADDEECWDELKEVIGSRSTEVETFMRNRELQEEPVPSIWRPQQSAIGIVHRDMVAASQLSNGALKPLMSTDEIDVVLKNVNHLSSRLARATGYRDLVAAVRAALSLLRLGMSLQIKETSEQRVLSDSHSSMPSSNLWLLNPTVVGHHTPVSVDYPLLVLDSMMCCISPPVDELQELLMDVYRRWTLERLKVEEQQREQAAGFKYDDDESDDVVAEREFKLLFPDYDEVPELPNREDTFVPELVEKYCSLLSNEESQSSRSMVETIVRAAEKLTQVKGLSSAVHLPALYMALKRRTRDNTSSSNTEFNFYTDSSPEEGNASVRFSEKVLRHVAPLLENWPEHDTLQTLERVSQDVISLPPRAPVAFRLSKIEQIHHYLYEWDRFASKEFKVGELMADASSLVVRWRRLELATWPALFAVERRRAADAAAPFWFHLFETLVSAPGDDMSAIAKVLIVFMAESPIGQFDRRLRLLSAFIKHLELLGEQKIQTCVTNVYKFFSQYTDQITRRIQELEKQLRKQVDEVVRLASWRDVNIHALKQSAQRSHRQLFKVVKKYRSVLETKANTETDLSLVSSLCVVDDFTVPKLHREWSIDWIKPLLTTSEWKNRPKHLRELDNTTQMVNSYVGKVSSEGLDILSDADLLSLASDVERRSKQLRDETPKVWSKENKKMISALRVEKQQLLTETLRELKKSGLRQAVSKATIANQLELTRVLALTPLIGSETNGIFFTMIEILPRLRSAVSEASSNQATHDVPQTDLQRGLAFAENSFALVLRLRRIAAKHFQAPELSAQLQQISNLTELASSPVNSTFELDSAKKALSNSAHLTRNVANVVMGTLSETPTGSTADKELNQLHILSNQVSHISDLQLRTSASKNWFDNVVSSINLVLTKLDGNPSSGLVSPVIDELLVMVTGYADDLQVSSSSEPTDNVEDVIVNVCQPVLVIIQQIVKILSDFRTKRELETEDQDGDDDGEWLTDTTKLSEKLLLTLRSTEMWKKIISASEIVFNLSISNDKLAGAYAANLLVFVHSYRTISVTVERLFTRLMGTTTAGTLKLSNLLLTLATQGFCSPQPTSEDSDDEEDSKGEGVGLGDGQGGQSSSKDVDEEDDDVTEAMQTSNPEQEERDDADDKEEDNAKEMEGDMAGQTEDMPPQDDDEQEDDNEEQEDEEDIDEGVGDLDDLDPNAVDEKMWDDQKEESNEKEKQTDQGVQGDKDEEAEAGNENEDQEQNKGETGEGNDEGDQEDQEPNDGDDGDDGENNGDEDSDVEAHDDNVNQENQEELEADVEQKEALELPEDMQLDSGEDEQNNENEEGDDQNDMDDEEEGEEGEEENKPADDALDNMNEAAEEEENGQANPEDSAEDAENGEDIENDEQGGEDSEDEMDVDEGKDENENMPEEDEQGEDAQDDGKEMDAENPASGDGAGADIEGLQGPNDDTEPKNEDQATTTEQKTDSAGQGASEEANAEQDNMSTGGGSGAQDEPQPQNEDLQDQSRPQNEALRESLKQLGDAMKEFHRRQRDIKEQDPTMQEDEAEKTSDKKDDRPLDGNEDLEHVGAEDAFDTQALGKSTNEQERQDIDESMAIDDDANRSEAEEQETAGDNDAEAEHGAGGAGETMPDDDENHSDEEDEEHQPVANAGMADFDHENSDESSDDKNTVPVDEEVVERGEDDLWQIYESKTHDLALILGEQLRLILEPTVASKLRGDYRTGKRLNMKRIIPYIASEFRKDKIWLRRTKPAKREYQIMLALDDSKSMGEPAVVDLAFQAIALVGKALSSIEAGQIGIAKFGSSTEIIHPLDLPFTPHAGNAVFKQFGFNQQRTNVHQLLNKSLDMFAEHTKSSEQWKLEIIVSDGITDDHAGLRTLVRRAYDEKVMLVFVVLDALNKDTSILDMNEVRYTSDDHGNPKLEVAKYMEEFPFDYYVIVNNIDDLPMVLASVLRQYFQAADL